MDSIETVSAVRNEDSFDLDKVDSILKSQLSGLEGKPSVKQYTSGASNLTYLLEYANKALVLRRPPLGSKPKSGHSMHREYTIINALQGHYPVPETFYYSSHEQSVIGAEFYVMERVAGRHITTEIPAAWGWGKPQTQLFCEHFWDKMVALHQLDYQALGLADFGRPSGYVSRQVSGWNERYSNALTDDADSFEDIRDWLSANQPSTEVAHCIVHGDFRIDNLILSDQSLGAEVNGNINAVLDWEIAALGDPLMDLGAALVYWLEVTDPPSLTMLKKQPSDAAGMFTRQQVVQYYLEKTGYQLDNFTFYYTYGIFRLAVIAQQIYYRYYHQQTTNKAYAQYGPGAKALGHYARHIIKHGMPL